MGAFHPLIEAFLKGDNPLSIAFLVLPAHTGLRGDGLIRPTLEDVSFSPRGGLLWARGKGEGFREIPLKRRGLPRSAAVAGRPHGLRGCGRLCAKYACRVGMEAHFHMFRHAFPTCLLREKDVDIAVVANLLGHHSLESTLIYVHSTTKDRARAVATPAE
jgi:integrase